VALARAFSRQELLDAGKHDTVSELANALGVNRNFIL
jgi:hypothetical protein